MAAKATAARYPKDERFCSCPHMNLTRQSSSSKIRLRGQAPSGSGFTRADMMLHFAYGSNMSRAQMGARCPGARALGTATLRHWRFLIGLAGHRSIMPRPGAVVHGVLWRLGPRQFAAINAYERIDSGLC